MPTIQCTRCGQTRDAMAFQPFQNDLGRRAFEQICAVCWGEWLKTQQQLINHYGLNLRDPKAKEFLFGNMEQFLFAGVAEPRGEGGD
ncbi:MAG: oxidative damage protection protein [Gemmatimonadales bacterium]